MKVLDLFSGIGGFSIGLEKAGFETVAFCEIEEFPRAILKRHWPNVPVYGDIKQLTGEQLRADGIVPDLICGGYPCQPFSTAGQRRGTEDDRHLWPEVHRLITEIRPSWCIFENVAGHIKLGLDEVLSDLESEGYAARTYNIPACAVDAQHQRQRVWIVAHANGSSDRRASRRNEKTNGEIPQRDNSRVVDQSSKVQTTMAHARHGARGDSIRGSVERNGKWEHEKGKRSQSAAQIARSSQASETMANAEGEWCDEQHRQGSEQSHRKGGIRGKTGASGQDVADTTSTHRQRGRVSSRIHEEHKNTDSNSDRIRGARTQFWKAEPSVGRVVNGIPHQSHRLKSLGNAVVPQIPEIIGRTILAFEAERGNQSGGKENQST